MKRWNSFHILSTPPFLTPLCARFSRFPGSVEILFCLYSFILCGSLENDPLSPPEGEAAQGEHPLDPFFFSGYISTVSGVIAIGGMPEQRGRKHEKVEPPRAIVCFNEDFNRADFQDLLPVQISHK
jgi:hypothetical protein